MDDFSKRIAAGQSVEVTHCVNRKLFPVGRLAIDINVYERYVQWDSSASRSSGVWLEEEQRLHALLQAAADVKRHEAPAYFLVRVVAADSGQGIENKTGFHLRQIANGTQLNWLITA